MWSRLCICTLFMCLHLAKAFQYTTIGCYGDVGGNRDFTGYSENSLSIMTNDYCAMTCFRKGYKYFGTQSRKECWCDDSYGTHGTSTACTKTCTGDNSQICGGYFALTVSEWRPVSWWKPVTDSRLSGHLLSSTITSTYMKCATTCSKNIRCTSFNYRAAGGECELNDAGAASGPAATTDAVTAVGWTWYYDGE